MSTQTTTSLESYCSTAAKQKASYWLGSFSWHNTEVNSPIDACVSEQTNWSKYDWLKMAKYIDDARYLGESGTCSVQGYSLYDTFANDGHDLMYADDYNLMAKGVNKGQVTERNVSGTPHREVESGDVIKASYFKELYNYVNNLKLSPNQKHYIYTFHECCDDCAHCIDYPPPCDDEPCPDCWHGVTSG